MRCLRNKNYQILNPFVVLSFFCFGFIHSSYSDQSKLEFSGKLFSDLYSPYKEPGRKSLRQFSESAWFTIDSHFNEHNSAHIELTADHYEHSQRTDLPTSQLELQLREGFVNIQSKNAMKLRIGKIIVPWGKSDGMNPTDFLTAKDYTFANPEEENKRIGAGMIEWSLTPNQGTSPFTFTAVFIPKSPHSKILMASDTLPASFSTGTYQAPTTTINHSEQAIKIAYNRDSWDASISGYRGFNHTPEFVLGTVGGTILSPTFSLYQTIHKQQAIGNDFSVSFDNWVIREEASVVWTENNGAETPMSIPKHYDAIVGVERPLFTDYRIQAQFYARYLPNLASALDAPGSTAAEKAANQAIASTNALLLNYQNKYRPTSTLRFSYTHPSLIWDAEVFTVYNYIGGDTLIRPKASYLFTDAFRTTIGVDHYAGPSDRPLGALTSFNCVFLEAKYTF